MLHYYEDVVHLSILRGDDVKDFGGELVVWHLRELPEDLDLSDDFLRVITMLKYSIN